MTAAGHQSRAGGVLKGLWALLHDAGAGWLKHQASRTGAALATVVGVLVEVPVMLSVVHIVLRTRPWYQRAGVSG